MLKRTWLIQAAAAVCLILLPACAPSPLPRPAAGAGATPDQATQSVQRTLPAIEGESTSTPSPETEQPAPSLQSTTPAVTAVGGKSANAKAFPDPAGYTWQTVANGFTRPLAVTGDRFGRLLVVEQAGKIWVVENARTRKEPYLDIQARVGSKGNEQGLLGLALHPDYAHNGLFYVNYTDSEGNTVIARFSADVKAATARADSQKILLQVKQPYPNHNGGSLAFGQDGFLYLGLGDGGSGGDPLGNGQNMKTLLGKLLRIDVDQGDPYAIPAGNPNQAGGGKAEIWASGLRNPWRFSFDRANGGLYIGDVGQNTYEEIDFLPATASPGANFGWNIREGLHAFQDNPASTSGLVDPVFEYKHPEGCSVTGGAVYRGAELPEFQGIYLFGDYCNGKIWGLLRGADGAWQSQLLFHAGVFVSSFGEDDQGELYLTDHQNGAVLKLSKKQE